MVVLTEQASLCVVVLNKTDLKLRGRIPGHEHPGGGCTIFLLLRKVRSLVLLRTVHEVRLSQQNSSLPVVHDTLLRVFNKILTKNKRDKFSTRVSKIKDLETAPQ